MPLKGLETYSSGSPDGRRRYDKESEQKSREPDPVYEDKIKVSDSSVTETSYDISIPRLIMQTWKSKDVPEKWKTSPESINRYMPGWTYVLMTDEDNREFVKKHFPDFLDIYDGFEYPIQRADAIRYMWLYVNGGLYIDLDYELNGSIEHLFTSDTGLFFMNSANYSQYWTNSIMASKAKHPFWLEVINRMREGATSLPWWAFGKHLQVMESTGPGVVSRSVNETKYQYTVLPVRLVAPRSVCEPRGTKHGLIETLEGCSWAGTDTMVYNWFYCNFKSWHIVLMAFIILVIIITLVVWLIMKSMEVKKVRYELNHRDVEQVHKPTHHQHVPVYQATYPRANMNPNFGYHQAAYQEQYGPMYGSAWSAPRYGPIYGMY